MCGFVNSLRCTTQHKPCDFKEVGLSNPYPGKTADNSIRIQIEHFYRLIAQPPSLYYLNTLLNCFIDWPRLNQCFRFFNLNFKKRSRLSDSLLNRSLDRSFNNESDRLSESIYFITDAQCLRAKLLNLYLLTFKACLYLLAERSSKYKY